MSLGSESNQASPARKRSLVPWLAGGCGVLGLCVLCGALLVGAYFFISQRTVTAVSVPSVEYILDATQRMAQLAKGENDTRLNIARGVLAEIVRPSDPTVTAGLRVFGSGAQSAACSDTDLLVALAPATQPQISTHLLSITNGVNPDAAMGQAMLSAIRDLAAIKGKHTLVVVTGGADSCNPQAGALMASEAQKAGIDLKLFVIGYQVTEGDGNAIKGLVDASGGNYVEADNKQQLKDVLVSIQQFVQDHTATSVANVIGTAAAAVGTQNVVVAGTPAALATPAPNGSATAAPNQTPLSNSTPAARNTSAAATPGGIGSATIGQTACDNPYFPMRASATWTFSTDTGSMTWTITGVTGDKTTADAVMEFKLKDLTFNYHWHCTPDGLVSYDFASLSGQSGTQTFNVTDHSGTWLPQADKLVPGATWDSAYTLQGTDSSSAATFSNTQSQHFTLVGIEPHDVLGQTLDALHIDFTGSSSVSAAGAAAVTFQTSGTYILARGVGPVQFVSKYGSVSSTTTLTSYSIP